LDPILQVFNLCGLIVLHSIERNVWIVVLGGGGPYLHFYFYFYFYFYFCIHFFFHLIVTPTSVPLIMILFFLCSVLLYLQYLFVAGDPHSGTIRRSVRHFKPIISTHFSPLRFSSLYFLLRFI
jgi:hypothetical protein